MLTPRQETEQLEQSRQQALDAADHALRTIVFRIFFGALAIGTAALMVHNVRDASTPSSGRIVSLVFFLFFVVEFGSIALFARSFVVRHLLSGSPVYLYTKATIQQQLRLPPEELRRRTAYLHPGRRCAARFIDYNIFAMLLCAAVPSLHAIVGNPWIGPIVATAMFVPTEALLHSSCGSTLGKYLFGVSLTHDDWDRPGFGEAIRRSFVVWVYGMCCGIPYFSMFRIAKEQSRLLYDEITTYDRTSEMRIEFAKMTKIRIALTIVMCTILAAGVYYTEVVVSPIPIYLDQMFRAYRIK